MKSLSKKNALLLKQPHQILYTKNFNNYYITDTHQDLLTIIFTTKENNKSPPYFYEFIPKKTKVNLFLDIDIDQQKFPTFFNNSISYILQIKEKIESFFSNYNCKFIILEAHSDQKKSYHCIVRFTDKITNEECYFQDVEQQKKMIKTLFPEFVDNIIDLSIYREGLFRTIYSSKYNEKRPFIKSDLSDPFDDIESFVTYLLNKETASDLQLEEDLQPLELQENSLELKMYSLERERERERERELTTDDTTIIKNFVRKNYRFKTKEIRDILIDRTLNCIIVGLTETFCWNVDREHKSNHQYIVIDTYSSKQKCHDLDCKDYKYNEIKINQFPKELNEIILKCLKVNKHEQELIEKAIIECKDYITQNFDEHIEEIQFDKQQMVFKGEASNHIMSIRGKCNRCQIVHQISDNGYCIKCNVCNTIFPKNQLIPVDGRYKALNSFWMNYNQLVNHGTINNIINIYNTTTPDELEFSCDVKLDQKLFNNKEITSIVNQILDGHKITMLSKLLDIITHKSYIYSKNHWYHFNGFLWKHDLDNIDMKNEFMNLSKLFDKIKTHYESKCTSTEINVSLIKNLKSLINKCHKPGFIDDVIKGAKMFCNDESFLTKLNSKNHLVPFENGVYDLLQNQFRSTNRDDYINLTVKYNYVPTVNNIEVHEFLQKILPKQDVRDYVLKKMSECLNGDIPNTNFLMFIGDGANGKSQLLNLMKATLGELAEKVEVTLLTRKRNNANETNTEKMKLMNKRFAFLSEPEDGEKINIGLLKELTGSEEIVARGLYQDSLSFVMEAKLFLACNELPEIKGEDTALWRRIRVVDFPSRFVDEPKEANEYKIDRTLPARMREDLSWKQTFMNILLDYYNKIIPEPIDVKLRTNEYRKENNDFFNWLEENIEYKENELLQLKDVCQIYLCKNKIHSSASSKYKKEIEKWIKEKHKNIKYEYGVVKINDSTFNGWKHLCIKC
jgi:P4 family phage/plasmid primase-like protien